jgi:hypothetical protein
MVIQEKLENLAVEALFPGALEAVKRDTFHARPFSFYLTETGQLQVHFFESSFYSHIEVWRPVIKRWQSEGSYLTHNCELFGRP